MAVHLGQPAPAPVRTNNPAPGASSKPLPRLPVTSNTVSDLKPLTVITIPEPSATKKPKASTKEEMERDGKALISAINEYKAAQADTAAARAATVAAKANTAAAKAANTQAVNEAADEERKLKEIQAQRKLNREQGEREIEELNTQQKEIAEKKAKLLALKANMRQRPPV